MMGIVTETRFTLSGSPKVPFPLSSHEPPPSVTLKKSPSETRFGSEMPSAVGTNKTTRRNRAMKDGQGPSIRVWFYSGLHPEANVPVA